MFGKPTIPHVMSRRNSFQYYKLVFICNKSTNNICTCTRDTTSLVFVVSIVREFSHIEVTYFFIEANRLGWMLSCIGSIQFKLQEY